MLPIEGAVGRRGHSMTSTKTMRGRAAGAALAGLVLAACGPTARDRAMEALTPAPIAPTAVASARRAPMRFRIYADAQWQAQKGDWRRVAEEMVEQAGGVVAATFGVGFVVERVAPWPDPGPDALSARLDALAGLDPGGADVWVVGLVGGVPVASSAFEQIGLAYTPGRHFVMRSMADVDEADAIDGYHALDAADKRRILRARKPAS